MRQRAAAPGPDRGFTRRIPDGGARAAYPAAGLQSAAGRHASAGGHGREQAQTPLYADNGGTATGDTASGQAQSAGEVALLQNAGAAGIDPGIRSQIDTESAARVERDPALISRLVLWGTAAPEGGTTIITTRKQGLF